MCRVFVCRNNRIRPYTHLWQGLCRIVPSLESLARPVIAFAGAGGKTTSIYALAAELAAMGRHVLIVTTTHMYIPDTGAVLSAGPAVIIQQLRRCRIVAAGVPAGQGKFSYLGDDVLRTVLPFADAVLIEADGARHLPLKIMASHEPAVPAFADVICCVAGLQALGQRAETACFRWPLAEEADKLIDCGSFAGIWKAGCLDILSRRYSQPVVPILNQADTAAVRYKGRQIFSALQRNGLLTSHYCCT